MSMPRPKLLAATVALLAGAGLTLAATAPPAAAEHVRVHPKVKAVRYVDVDRTTAAVYMTAQVINTERQRLQLQEWGLDTYGDDDAELLVDWFVGDRFASVSRLGSGHLRPGCRRAPATALARGTGAKITLPGRCLVTGPQTVRRVGVNHVSVMTVKRPGADTCHVYQVPRRGYLGPLGVGNGPDRAARYGTPGPRPLAASPSKGC